MAIKTYVVKSGDTLSAIAKEHLGDASKYVELARINQIANPNIIEVGDTLKIPDNHSTPVEMLDLTEEVAPQVNEVVPEVIEEKTELVPVSYENHVNADFNKNNFAIKPHSRIDNEAGMREKRIQYLTDGYTSENPPSRVDLEKLMTKIEIPILNGGKMDQKTLIVNKKLAKEIQSVFVELAEKGYEIELADGYGYEVEGYEYRTTGSSGRLSDHAYGGAIDINARHNPMTGPRDALNDNDGTKYVVNQQVINIFAKHGFYWGGDWNTSCDPMHFSFTGW